MGVAALSACSASPRAVSASSEAVRSAETARIARGSELVTAQLVSRPVNVDLGGLRVSTWAYGESVPGPLIRAKAGDRLRVAVNNQLPVETSVHWHGIALRNDMDGVPGMTQQAIRPGARSTTSSPCPTRARTSTTRMSECSWTVASTACCWSTTGGRQAGTTQNGPLSSTTGSTGQGAHLTRSWRAWPARPAAWAAWGNR